MYDSQEQKEDKENRNSSLCGSPSVRSVSEQKTEFANGKNFIYLVFWHVKSDIQDVSDS